MSAPSDDSIHVRDLVDVVLDSWTEPLVAAVERVGADTLAIEAPRDRGGRVVLPDVGESGLLVWRGSRDLQQAPVSIVQTRRPPSAQWLLRLTGRQSVCQRRSFVRADVVLPVLLQLEGGEREVTALDISEGGLRCSTTDRDGLSGGTVVGVHLDLDPLVLDLQAEVVRARHPGPERPLDLGLRFLDLSIKDADRLRAWIFTELRRVRANAG
jgi:hypothetical protein